MPVTGWPVPAFGIPGATDVIIPGDDVPCPELAPRATAFSKLAAYSSAPASVRVHALAGRCPDWSHASKDVSLQLVQSVCAGP